MKNNQLQHFGIEFVAKDLGIELHTDGLLAIESNADSIGNIIQKPFRSLYFAIMFVTEGEVTVKVNMFEYVLSPGKILAVSASAIKEFIKVDEESKMFSLLYTEDYILNSPLSITYPNVINPYSTNTHYLLKLSSEIFGDISQLLHILSRRYPVDTHHNKTADLLTFAVLNQLSEEMQKWDSVSPSETKSRRAELVIRFTQLLPKYVREERTIGFYARQLNVNDRYLSNTVKEKTGKPASVLIAEMLTQEARLLLNNPKNSISEVAEELGFPDQFTFSKYFKKNTGLSPSNYRKS